MNFQLFHQEVTLVYKEIFDERNRSWISLVSSKIQHKLQFDLGVYSLLDLKNKKCLVELNINLKFGYYCLPFNRDTSIKTKTPCKTIFSALLFKVIKIKWVPNITMSVQLTDHNRISLAFDFALVAINHSLSRYEDLILSDMNFRLAKLGSIQ